MGGYCNLTLRRGGNDPQLYRFGNVASSSHVQSQSLRKSENLGRDGGGAVVVVV